MAKATKQMRSASTEAIRWEKLAWNDIIPRLMLFAKRQRMRMPTGLSLPSEEDLVSSAIEKTMSGVRGWKPDQIGLLEHLFGVVKSDLYNEVRKSMRYSSDDISADLLASRIPSSDLTPEEIASNRSVLSHFMTELKAKDQDVYEWFLLSLLHGSPEEESQRSVGFSKGDIANMRRRLRRHIKSFVEGVGEPPRASPEMDQS